MTSTLRSSDLVSRLEEQLGRYGVAGRIERDGTCLRLRGHGSTIQVEFPDLEDFDAATELEQERRLDRIVRELVRMRRAGSTRGPARPHIFQRLTPFAVVAALAFGMVVSWKWLGRPARDAAITTSDRVHSVGSAEIRTSVIANPSNVHKTADERCSQVQARISTGGSVSQLDVDGWVVELALLSRDPSLEPTSPRLDAFLARGTGVEQARQLVWTEDEELRSLGDAGSFAIVSKEPLIDVIVGTRGGVRVAFTGKYVGKYFDESSRLRMQRLAAAMYEATNADYGALYARCALGSVHQVGSWFRGKDGPSTIVALVAAMGLHAEVVHLEGADPRTATPIAQRRTWDSLAERAKPFDRKRLTIALANEGGLVAAKPGAWVTLTFPFQDANRASRASLRMARSMGLAPRL